MKRRLGRTDQGASNSTPRVGLDSMHGRLLLGLLVLALVPALVGLLLVSFLTQGPDTKVATERARQTSAAAADLLVRSQAIETRLAVLAADADTARLSGSSTSSTRQLARRVMSSLRGADGSIVAGACVTRVADGRTTVIAEDHARIGANASCTKGASLAAAGRLAEGATTRSQPQGTDHLLIAARISTRGNDLVLSAAIDLETLLQRTPATARTAATSVVVDQRTADFVAGTTNAEGASSAVGATTPMDPRGLASYAMGILSGYRATNEALAQAGWTTTTAELWPTSATAGLGLIQAWPAPPSSASTATWLALVAAALVALAGVAVLMRLLLQPFRELRDSQSQMESAYHEARKDSLHDGLTGLGNHRAFQDELAHQMELSERDGVSFSVMLVDLDNLKIVNDREGHAEGDRLLTGLATAMRGALRDTDRIFRIGGDEFAVLMPSTEPEEATEAASRLRHYCLRPPNGERPMPFSGGISAVPRFALDASLLQRQADVALYWAKRHGRGFVEVFDPERDQVAGDEGPAGLGNAVCEIARGRLFKPVYQPIVDLRTGAVLGFEGLVRPDTDGPITDAERLFSAAAATGRTVELDLASFETVAEGAREFGSDHLISINLSAKTLEVRDFDAGWLLNTLVRHGISPSRVVVELTERDPITDVARLQNNVRHLGEYGLRLAADDVGAGSAGLRMLAEIPFDIVKIDLGLVQSGAQHAASWEVLRSIRDFAWRQKSVVIGEGVETPEQLRALQQLGIPVAQGYLLGRPEPQPDMRLRDMKDLVTDPQSGLPAPTRPRRDEGGLPRAPELLSEQPSPRPIPLQLQSLPAGQI